MRPAPPALRRTRFAGGPRRRPGLAALFCAAVVMATSCGGEGTPILQDALGVTIPPAPDIPEGPLAPELADDLDLIFGDLGNTVDTAAIGRVGESGDPRAAWLLSDLLRFVHRGHVVDAAVAAFERLTGTEVPVDPWASWLLITNWLIGWDLPAPPGYLHWKRLLFEFAEPGWAPFFADEDADVDWRLISWGGVFVDGRPLDAVRFPCPEGCIPALDGPAVTDAAGGDWYPDDRLVFGVVIGGEARAYPKHIMEFHELVNDTLGGRRVGVVYCTLCASAQAYLTDAVPPGFEPLELRTSGLLSRSNKVMFDFHTYSMFDTFTGRAISGSLQDAGLELEMISVRTSTWGDWKAAHPGTTIVARDGGINKVYADDPLQGRDDQGPIFPVGAVDPRLPVQQMVLGVLAPDGTALAFPVQQAADELAAGRPVEMAGVRVTTDGAGLGAAALDGALLASHQAFWFAWSQFHPGTAVWAPIDPGG